MSNLYNKKDDFFRDKLTGHEFDAVPGAWEDMSKLLNQQQLIQGSGSSLWWSIPVLSALLLSGIIGTGIYFKSSYDTNPISAANQKLVLNNEGASSTQSTDILNRIKSNPTQNTATTNNLQDLTFNKPNITNLTPPNPVLPNTSTLTTTSTSNNATSPTNYTVNTNKSIPSIEPSAVVKPNDQKTKILSSSSVNPDITTPSSNENYLTSNTTNETSLILADKINTEGAVADPSPVNNKPLPTENKLEKTKTTRIITINYFSSSTFLKQQKLTKITPPTEPIPFGVKASLKKQAFHPIRFSIYAGMSSQYLASVNEFNFSPLVGIAASHKFAPRHGIRIGLHYKSISRKNRDANLENSELRYESGFVAAKSFLLKHLDLIELPISYQLYFNKFINLNAGIKAAWVVNHESSNPDYNNININQIGISNFNLGLLLGVEFNLNRNICLGIQYNQGLMNMTQNALSNEQQMMLLEESTGVNSTEKQTALTNSGEIATPITEADFYQQLIRVPYRLHNSDVFMYLKYTF